MIKIKRAYDAPAPEDGIRVLVDRLWPRGVSKKRARIDLWLKDIAPSAELRKSFAHDPEKWADFRSNYGRELDQKRELLSHIESLERTRGTVTLIFGAKDQLRNNALVLRDRLTKPPSARAFRPAA